MAVLGGGAGHPADRLVEKLNERGYEATVYESLKRKAAGKGEEELAKLVMSAYEGKAPISDLTDNYDLVISAAKVDGLMQPIERVYWPSCVSIVYSHYRRQVFTVLQESDLGTPEILS